MKDYQISRNCPICGLRSFVDMDDNRRLQTVNCKRCGNFSLSDDAFTMFSRSDERDKILSVAYWIQRNQNPNAKLIVDIAIMRKLLTPFIPPSPKEQANNLLKWIGDNFPLPSQECTLRFDELISIVGAMDTDGVQYILDYLINIGCFSNGNLFHGDSIGYSGVLSFHGWDLYGELKRIQTDSRLVFMAMQFDNESLLELYNNIIVNAVAQTDFKIRKVNDVKRTGLIDDKIKVEIRKSKFVIADLTDENRGAYWEAGFANGLGIEVIYICEKEKFESLSTHFDTNHHHTIKWGKDPSTWNDFAEELKATIRESFPADAKMDD